MDAHRRRLTRAILPGLASAGFLLGFICVPAPLQASECEPLSLHAALDDSVYLPGQPILLIATVVNNGDSTVHDLGHLTHPNFLRGVLYREGRQVPDGYGLRGAGWIYSGGIALQPRDSICAVHEVFEQAGGPMRIDMPFGPSYRAKGLPSGKYRMEVHFRCRVSPYEIGRDVMRCRDLEFTVRRASAIRPLDERALRRLEKARTNRLDDRTLENWAELRRKGLDASPYIVALADAFMPNEDPARTRELALDLMRAGVPSSRLAALLARYLPRIKDADQRRAWTREVGLVLEDPTFQCLLRSTQTLLEWHEPKQSNQR